MILNNTFYLVFLFIINFLTTGRLFSLLGGGYVAMDNTFGNGINSELFEIQYLFFLTGFLIQTVIYGHLISINTSIFLFNITLGLLLVFLGNILSLVLNKDFIVFLIVYPCLNSFGCSIISYNIFLLISLKRSNLYMIMYTYSFFIYSFTLVFFEEFIVSTTDWVTSLAIFSCYSGVLLLFQFIIDIYYLLHGKTESRFILYQSIPIDSNYINTNYISCFSSIVIFTFCNLFLSYGILCLFPENEYDFIPNTTLDQLFIFTLGIVGGITFYSLLHTSLYLCKFENNFIPDTYEKWETTNDQERTSLGSDFIKLVETDINPISEHTVTKWKLTRFLSEIKKNGLYISCLTIALIHLLTCVCNVLFLIIDPLALTMIFVNGLSIGLSLTFCFCGWNVFILYPKEEIILHLFIFSSVLCILYITVIPRNGISRIIILIVFQFILMLVYLLTFGY